MPCEASRPSRPIGNQHRKSDRATVIRRRAILRSLDFLVESLVDILLARMEAQIEACPAAISRKRMKLKMIMTP